jgi:hypothetical protein
VAAGARLKLEGVEPIRVEALIFHGNNFMGYCEEEGFCWEACLPGPRVGYIEYIPRKDTVGAASIAGYVSDVNSFFTKLSLLSPGLLEPGKLHPAVKSAQEGYRRRCKRLNPPPPEHPAMPVSIIALMLESLTAALGRGSLETSRALMAPITQFYLIQRPTLVSSLTWSQIQVSRTILSIRLDAITTGRKNKLGTPSCFCVPCR